MKEMEILKGVGQEHLLKYWNELSDTEKKSLSTQIENTDWSVLENLEHPEDLSGKGDIQPIAGLRTSEIEKMFPQACDG